MTTMRVLAMVLSGAVNDRGDEVAGRVRGCGWGVVNLGKG